MQLIAAKSSPRP